MRKIGISTGSLYPLDYINVLDILRDRGVKYVELSVLREAELDHFMNTFDTVDMSSFDYISVHVPSRLSRYSEKEVINYMQGMAERNWFIIVHPDIIINYDNWLKLGKFLCIENLDKRKGVGRTYFELANIFSQLPEAQFCLDLAHSKQIDPSMSESVHMLTRFKDRLRQVHVSALNSNSRHEVLNVEALLAYNSISNMIPNETVIIVESPISLADLDYELKKASLIFNLEDLSKTLLPYIDSYKNSRI